MSNGINTGMQRAVEFVVTKKVNGEVVEGYPRTYPLKQAFGNYQETTENELSLMLIDDYMARLGAFKAHVESIDMGAKVDKASAYSQNTGLCPIPDANKMNYITVTYYWVKDVEWGNIVYKLTMQADRPVASDINIKTTVHIAEQSGFVTVNLPLKSGESYYEIETFAIDQHISEIADPGYDNTYEYQTKAVDVYE